MASLAPSQTRSVSPALKRPARRSALVLGGSGRGQRLGRPGPNGVPVAPIALIRTDGFGQHAIQERSLARVYLPGEQADLLCIQDGVP